MVQQLSESPYCPARLPNCFSPADQLENLVPKANKIALTGGYRRSVFSKAEDVCLGNRSECD